MGRLTAYYYTGCLLFAIKLAATWRRGELKPFFVDCALHCAKGKTEVFADYIAVCIVS